MPAKDKPKLPTPELTKPELTKEQVETIFNRQKALIEQLRGEKDKLVEENQHVKTQRTAIFRSEESLKAQLSATQVDFAKSKAELANELKEAKGIENALLRELLEVKVELTKTKAELALAKASTPSKPTASKAPVSKKKTNTSSLTPSNTRSTPLLLFEGDDLEPKSVFANHLTKVNE